MRAYHDSEVGLILEETVLLQRIRVVCQSNLKRKSKVAAGVVVLTDNTQREKALKHFLQIGDTDNKH